MDSFINVDAVNSDVVLDEDMGIITADECFEQISGNDAYLVYTRYIHPDDVDRFNKAIENYRDNNQYTVVRMLFQDGKYHLMLTRIEDGGISEEKGQLYNIKILDAAAVITLIDNLNEEAERYASYLGMTDNILFSYDIEKDDFRIFMVTDGKQTMSFYNGSLGDWKESRIKSDALEHDAAQELETFCNALYNGEKFFKREMTVNLLNKIGRIDKCAIKGKTILSEDGTNLVIGVITIDESADARGAEAYAGISDMKDPGTDLLNKRAITDYVRNLIDSKPDKNVTIAIIDVDDFKTINDTYGHMFGDEVLYKVADILRDAVGRKGLCGRIGGDEMFIVMEGLKDDEGIRNVLRTVRNNVSWLYHDDPRNINKITCSIGSATYPYDARDYDELFKIADKMLYLAKEKGKNRYIIYHEDIHREYVYGMGRIVDLTEKVFYRYHKMDVVNTIIREYREATDKRRQELLEMIVVAFDLDTIILYDQKLGTKYILYGEQRMSEDNGSYLKEDNYIPGFREDGLFAIDNINFFEVKAPALYKVYSKYGITQAVQYIIGGNIKKNNNIISFARFKQNKKWAEMDMNFLAVIGDYIGNTFLKERVL
ncbi:MAG: sensor domain-containing diguanylate cyclase [Clostridia bacterium]|nr:sensor domain-containing diguanylate cyclase [Clostridia bacterium]